ncbi:MAG: hypothetical protein CVV44_17095 [Spirochaetae bacterium HGW-Spirochaetae-1]|jgi:nitrogen fixation/metabolism regulation signal transduction histidine kinase|nr:MAG: hypothetical protein CVV44_17095 [Spirochaetae bacterium HGW-Spirochaetae-1]
MKQRKQYIIDKNFQLKTTFSIIAIVSVISAIIIGGIATNIVYNNVKIKNIYEIEDNIVHFLTSRPISGQDEAMVNAMREIAINHSENMETLNVIIELNQILLVALIVAIVLQSILLYVLLIRKTHRISGPIFVMSNYIKEVIDGKWPTPRPLRDKDELKTFYHLFTQMVNVLKERDKNQK